MKIELNDSNERKKMSEVMDEIERSEVLGDRVTIESDCEICGKIGKLAFEKTINMFICYQCYCFSCVEV